MASFRQIPFGSDASCRAFVVLNHEDIIVEDSNDCFSDTTTSFDDIETHQHFFDAAKDLSEPLLHSGVVAEAVPLAPRTSRRGRQTGSCAAALSEYYSHSRAEYLCARSYKPTPISSTGLFLVQRKGRVYIKRIARDSIFCSSNLEAGDRLLSVNGVAVGQAVKAARLIAAADTTVTLIVHNIGGHSGSYSSSVQKPSPDAVLGIGFQNKQGTLYISRVDEDGLFGDCLLLPRHRCILVNGIPVQNSRQAADIAAKARDVVTIDSRPPDTSTALVVACETQQQWWSRVAVVAGVVAGAVGAAGSLAT